MLRVLKNPQTVKMRIHFTVGGFFINGYTVGIVIVSYIRKERKSLAAQGSLTYCTTLTVAVSEKIIGLSLILDFFDRCHSLRSLYPPQAALPSLPTVPVYADGFELFVVGTSLTSV